MTALYHIASRGDESRKFPGVGDLASEIELGSIPKAIHLVLLMDSLFDDYTRSWESGFAAAFDDFRYQLGLGKQTRDELRPSEYWLRYGVHTRVNSDRGDSIQRRHEFFSSKMRTLLKLQMKDSQRVFGSLERELIYYRDKKLCARCGADVVWAEAEIHHIEEHAKGGTTTLDNGALVHRHCHPKGAAAVEFAKEWRKRNSSLPSRDAARLSQEGPGDEDDDENDDVT